ncbi:leucine-rich repeat domain-containing protein [Ruminococcus flavefaciens]|uniref:leucine-rich repeat domain-containing protein n=1 Tax=Ruminococcus flavefaciens TaxID=1265 RepID=UPI0003071997|nr:leucine-rich repeat domain-containing protein [Ruminococcus flavefaciens]
MKMIFAVAASVMTLLAPMTEIETASAGSFDYSIFEGEVTVTGYSGEPGIIEIPEFIRGCPVTEVRDNAFYNCHSLKSISLPDTVLKIGHHSFYACYELEEVRLPAELEEIGIGCFCGCAALKEIDIPETLKVLPDSCFRACGSLEAAVLPEDLEAVDKFCFAGCTELRYVQTGSSLGSIGERSFYMCGRLESIVVPPSVRTIDAEALGYTCDGNLMLRQTDMLIIGREGSAAEEYARENDISFAADEEKEVFAEISSDSVTDCENAASWLGAAVFLLLAAVFFLFFIRENRHSLNDDEDV